MIEWSFYCYSSLKWILVFFGESVGIWNVLEALNCRFKNQTLKPYTLTHTGPMIQLPTEKRLKFDSTLEAEVFPIWRNNKTYIQKNIHISSTVEFEMTNPHKCDELRLDDICFQCLLHSTLISHFFSFLAHYSSVALLTYGLLYLLWFADAGDLIFEINMHISDKSKQFWSAWTEANV